jgi:hypothetical protein
MTKLFKFPIVMIDARKEDSGRVLGIGGGADSEYVIGEAELPAEDFIGILDRWLPSSESYEKAQEGIFEACHVIFGHSGSWTCAWPKEKFKARLEAFLLKQAGENPDMQTIILNPKQIDFIMSLSDKKEEDKNEEEDGEKDT